MVFIYESRKDGFSSEIDAGALLAAASPARALRELIAEQIGVPLEGFKLICAGRILKDDPPLVEQGVKNDSRIVLFRTSTTPAVQKQQQEQQHEKSPDKKRVDEDSQQQEQNKKANKNYGADELRQQHEDEKNAQRLRKIREAAEEMASRSDGGAGRRELRYFELENQYGEKVQLPPEVRRALIIGMTLSEKARTFVKESDYKNALELLRQADEEFNKCPAHLLTAIDNYGILNLDICWCYYQLQDERFMRDAYERLRKARDSFERCYGRDLQRLRDIKGSNTGGELALYFRLNILQGVIRYHAGNIDEAKRLLTAARKELDSMKIKDEDVARLSAMGFSLVESKRALRACANNVDEAITYIFNKREQARTKREEERQRRRERAEQLRLGKTSKGNLVNLKLMKSLIDMGFERELVVEALRQADNDEVNTCNLLTSNRGVLEASILAREQSKNSKSAVVEPRAEDVAQLCAMGFTASQARRALQRSCNDFVRAVDLLVSGYIPLVDTTTQTSSSNTNGDVTVPAASMNNNNDEDDDDDDDYNERPEKTEEELRREQLERDIDEELLPGMSQDSEAIFDQVLDLLQEEEQVLNKYLAYIQQL